MWISGVITLKTAENSNKLVCSNVTLTVLLLKLVYQSLDRCSFDAIFRDGTMEMHGIA